MAIVTVGKRAMAIIENKLVPSVFSARLSLSAVIYVCTFFMIVPLHDTAPHLVPFHCMTQPALDTVIYHTSHSNLMGGCDFQRPDKHDDGEKTCLDCLTDDRHRET